MLACVQAIDSFPFAVISKWLPAELRTQNPGTSCYSARVQGGALQAVCCICMRAVLLHGALVALAGPTEAAGSPVLLLHIQTAIYTAPPAGAPECFDLQIQTTNGPKDLRMRASSPDQVEEIVSVLMKTANVRRVSI